MEGTTILIVNQRDATVRSQFYFTARSLHMFRVLSTPIIRSSYNCNCRLRYSLYIVAANFIQRGQVGHVGLR